MSNTTTERSVLPEGDQLINCETCLTSVPLSESHITEAEEYIAYFCGLECYDLWVHQQPKNESAKKQNIYHLWHQQLAI